MTNKIQFDRDHEALVYKCTKCFTLQLLSACITGQDATPTILELDGMEGADGNSLGIIEKIAAGNYERFGIHLLRDANGTRVKLLMRNNNDPENVTWKILQQWLESDAAPRTYQHLMKCLKRSGLSALAVSIGNAIRQGAFTHR